MEHMYLSGADDVRQGGNAMREAASDMRQAAASISESMDALRRMLDDHAQQIATILEEDRAARRGAAW